MASLFTIDQLPATSADAIQEFSERYLAGISKQPPNTWARELGDVFDVGSPLVTLPIALMATKFAETKEAEGRFKTLAEKSHDVKVVEFDAGHEAKALDLLTNVFAYRNWSKAPAAFLDAEEKHVRAQIATLLEAGTSGTTPWDSLAFFSASHLANPANSATGTFSNYQSSTKDPASITNLEAEITLMMGVKDENGDKLGVSPTHILLPTEKFMPVSWLLSQNFLATGETNPLAGKLIPVHCPELTDANDWYLLDANLAKQAPGWVAMRYRPSQSLGLRSWDESSDFYKDTGKVKVAAHIWYGTSLLFPHAIRLVKGA